MKPLISVIIATYYRNELVKDAIDSVLTQEYEPVELIVVDDSGERHAEPVLAEYGSALTAIYHEENGDWAAAYSTGIAEASGSYIQFLDDDDYLLPGKLAKTATVLDENPNIGVAYCGLEQDTLGPVYPDSAVSGDILERALRFRTFPLCTITMLMRADVLADAMPLATFADDLNLKIELATRTNFGYVDECLVYRRKRAGRKWEGLAMINEMKQVISHQHSLYEQYPAIRRAVLADTYWREGQIRLSDKIWSAKAIACFAKATYFGEGQRFLHGGRLIASLFGRPGVSLARKIRSSVVK